MSHPRVLQLPILLALAVAACAEPPTAADDARPSGFTAATTIGDPRAGATTVGGIARWRVVEGAGAPAGKRVIQLFETKNRGEVFNLLLRDLPAPADVAIAVRLRADAGFDDRGGGLVWRAKDEQSYYLCRWNPLEKNLRAYCVKEGRRIQLQSVSIEADPAAWHDLSVTMKGRVIEVAFDGRPAISCSDLTCAEAGRVGLWTKADARSSFDDLRVGPVEKAR